MRLDLTRILPGKGNLDARAIWAAVVGPYRLAHGGSRAVPLQPDKPQKIASNPGSSEQVMFVGVALQQSTPGPVAVLFSNGDNIGNSNVPAVLVSALGLSGVSFSAVLLPGEDLHAQAPALTNIVVFSVGF